VLFYNLPPLSAGISLRGSTIDEETAGNMIFRSGRRQKKKKKKKKQPCEATGDSLTKSHAHATTSREAKTSFQEPFSEAEGRLGIYPWLGRPAEESHFFCA
jgi:uncharacterized protein (DUF2345 family)